MNHALGQELDYNPSPVLGPYSEDFWKTTESDFIEKCKPVYEAIEKVREELDDSNSLIGFAAAPYTICKYMCEEQKLDVVENLIPFIVTHLSMQIEAGCDTIQIFDSHACDISEEDFESFVMSPTKIIVDVIRAHYPHVCIIAFPRLVGKKINDYIDYVNPDAINISDDLPVDEIKADVIQGGISVKRLIKGEDITPVLNKMKDRPYVVNLAHGIHKTTPVENVRQLVNTVKEYRS